MSLDVSVDVFGVVSYLIYSDGSVRIKLFWRNVDTTDVDIIHRTCNLPLTINSKKYHCVTITQSDANVWHNDVAYQLFDTKIDLHVNSYSVDYMSTLIVDIFAFI